MNVTVPHATATVTNAGCQGVAQDWRTQPWGPLPGAREDAPAQEPGRQLLAGYTRPANARCALYTGTSSSQKPAGSRDKELLLHEGAQPPKYCAERPRYLWTENNV